MKMTIDAAFLEILVCPATRQKLHPLDGKDLEELNRRVAGGSVKTVDGRKVEPPVEDGLITEDRMRIYPVREGIPVLLVEEAIDLQNNANRSPEGRNT